MRRQAVFRDAVIAESEDTVVVEGKHYFPVESLRGKHFSPSSTTNVCAWKGTASYCTVEVGGTVNPDAAWTYPTPSPLAQNIRDHVAFWKASRPVRPPPQDGE